MHPLNLFAVRILISTAMLITLRLRSYASDPLPYFQRLERADYTTDALDAL
jgi:hypothetical protein